jgi:DEAD/DEAH box helicase domain-containing protein
MDQIVFDIETKNSFADVGGQQNVGKLEASVVGVYSYKKDNYFCFTEHELEKLGQIFKESDLLVGFAIKRFDLPVLKKHFNFDLSIIPCFDILEEIEQSLGWRVGLDNLAKANLGLGKTAVGLEAIEFYRQGEIEKLKDYCLNDVRLTKDLYELLKNQGYLWIPQKFQTKMLKWEYQI